MHQEHLQFVQRSSGASAPFDRTFAAGQRSALLAFGVEPELVVRPQSGAIQVAALAGAEWLGGYRLYPAATGELPLEMRCGRLPEGQARGSLAEFGGFWVCSDRRGTELSQLLLWDALRRAARLGLEQLLLFGHERILPLYEAWGWRPDPRCPPSVGYPTAAYVSRVLGRRLGPGPSRSVSSVSLPEVGGPPPD